MRAPLNFTHNWCFALIGSHCGTIMQLHTKRAAKEVRDQVEELAGRRMGRGKVEGGTFFTGFIDIRDEGIYCSFSFFFIPRRREEVIPNPFLGSWWTIRDC